jgi:hypothetical protein
MDSRRLGVQGGAQRGISKVVSLFSKLLHDVRSDVIDHSGSVLYITMVNKGK